ncbi:MAG: hypothetical protein IPM52_11225 [Bacteroidetes bacterium]|nr:hypothetical protein [Bacteroidota bacterium]
MRTLEYLYCKYYAFQARIGHRDIAPFSAMLIIVFSTFLYIISLFMLLNFMFGIHVPKVNAAVYLVVFCFMLVVFYFLLVHKGKYKEVLKRSDATNKSSLGAILFPLIAFILFNAGWILKMLQNQGKL